MTEIKTEIIEISNKKDKSLDKSTNQPETPTPLFLNSEQPLENKNLEEMTPISIKPKETKVIAQEDITKKKDEENKGQTILGATFLFANTSLGTTIFTFAIRAKQFGLFWFLIFAILAAVINIWTVLRLIEAVKDIKERDYSIVVEKILGKKWAVLLNIFLGLYCLLFLMTYMTLIYALIGRFICSIWYKEKYPMFDDFKKEKWNKAQYKFPIIFGYCFILYFVSLLKNMEKLNFAGYLGFIAVSYSVLIVVIQCDKYYKWYKNNERIEGDKSTYPNYFDFGKAFTKDLFFFKGMASLFAAYTNHSNVFPIYKSFDGVPDGKRKMIWSVWISNGLIALLHFLTILCAFLTEPLKPEDLIVYRINRFGGYDIWMNIAKVSCAICLFFSTPLYFVGLRIAIQNAFFKEEITDKQNYIVTGICYFISALVACLYDKILNYITYGGGFTSIVFSYLYPIILYIITNGKGFTYWKNFIELMGALILCIIGVLAGILTIINDIKGENAS